MSTELPVTGQGERRVEENVNQLVVFFYTGRGCCTIKADFTKPVIGVSQPESPVRKPDCVRMWRDRSLRSITSVKGAWLK